MTKCTKGAGVQWSGRHGKSGGGTVGLRKGGGPVFFWGGKGGGGDRWTPEPQGSRTDHMHSPYLLDFLFSNKTLMRSTQGEGRGGGAPFNILPVVWWRAPDQYRRCACPCMCLWYRGGQRSICC